MEHLHERGQATIELLLILAVLFIILGYALQQYSITQNAANQKRGSLDAERSATLLRHAVEGVFRSPVGSQYRLFIPPATQGQSIRFINGKVEVTAGGIVLEFPSLYTDVNSSTFYDGNIIVVTRTLSGVSFT
jgi:hypothetical protein